MERMISEEKIEALVNRAGLTIGNLPKPSDGDWSMAVYSSEDLIKAKKEALCFLMEEWRDTEELPWIKYEVEEILLDYICHLFDVIRCMGKALEKQADVIDGFLKVGYPHDYQYEALHIVNYMRRISGAMNKAFDLEEGKE